MVQELHCHLAFLQLCHLAMRELQVASCRKDVLYRLPAGHPHEYRLAHVLMSRFWFVGARPHTPLEIRMT